MDLLEGDSIRVTMRIVKRCKESGWLTCQVGPHQFRIDPAKLGDDVDLLHRPKSHGQRAYEAATFQWAILAWDDLDDDAIEMWEAIAVAAREGH